MFRVSPAAGFSGAQFLETGFLKVGVSQGGGFSRRGFLEMGVSRVVPGVCSADRFGLGRRCQCWWFSGGWDEGRGLWRSGVSGRTGSAQTGLDADWVRRATGPLGLPGTGLAGRLGLPGTGLAGDWVCRGLGLPGTGLAGRALDEL